MTVIQKISENLYLRIGLIRYDYGCEQLGSINIFQITRSST